MTDTGPFQKAMGHVLPVIGGKITGGIIVGALIALTGFGPEHWFAVAFEKLGLASAVAAAKRFGIDYRLVLVALGVAIVCFDVVRRSRKEPVPAASAPAVAASSISLPPASAAKTDSPPPLSLVVLPFQNLSDDAGQDYFVDGLVEDITTEMSRLSGAFVISRNTAFTFKGRSVDVKSVTSELKVRYALEGSVRKSGSQLRVSGQLVDGASGRTLWAERFDRDVVDVFQLQDAIAREVASILNVKLIEAEGLRSATMPNPTSYDFVLQARAAMNKGYSEANFQEAVALYERGIQVDPNNVEALAGLANTLAFIAVTLFPTSSPELIQRASSLARKATEIDPLNMRARSALALTLRAQGHWEAALQQYSEAIRIDPNFIGALHGRSVTLVLLEQYQQAAAAYAEILALSPRDPLIHYVYAVHGMAEYGLGHFSQAIELENRALRLNPYSFTAYLYLAASLAMLGREPEARDVLQAFVLLDRADKSVAESKRSAVASFGKVPQIVERLYVGLRKAGFPEQ